MKSPASARDDRAQAASPMSPPTATSMPSISSPPTASASDAGNGCFKSSGPNSMSMRSATPLASDLETEIDHLGDTYLSDEYVRYGDFVKLFATSQYYKQDLALKKDKSMAGTQIGGYIGVYEKRDGQTRVAVPPMGENAEGTFKESILQVQDPSGEIPDGTVVRYGDTVILVDKNGMVWNNKCGVSFTGFFEGYLGPRPRGTNGEVYVSFQKNGHDLRPVVFGDNAVYIEVQASHRYRTGYNCRLTNYRASTSRIVGGYVCSDSTGYDLPFSVHRHSGPPVKAYESPAQIRRRTLSEKGLLASKGSSAHSSGHVFVPPKIKSVSVERGGIDGARDVMIQEPLYGRPIKLYMVRPEDFILIELDQEHGLARISADHLFSAAESAAANMANGPLELNIAIDKDAKTAAAAPTPTSSEGVSPSDKVAEAVGSKLELIALELLVEQDLNVLKRAFQDDNNSVLGETSSPGSSDDASKPLSKLDLLIASHKLAMVYFACAVVAPYLVWQCILVVGELIEPIHALSQSNKSLALIERLATTLVQDFGIDVVDGRALIEDAHRNMDTTTLTSSLIAFFVAYAMGLVTPDFARHPPSPTVEGPGEEAANWLIHVQVPDGAWDHAKMERQQEQAEAAAAAAASASSRPTLSVVESTQTILEDDLAEDGRPSKPKSAAASAQPEGASGKPKYTGAENLGGAWGEQGVDENGIPKHPAFGRFLAGEKGNTEAAIQRWARTCEWRVEGKIDEILDQPHPRYHVLKKHVPNYYCGRGKTGHPVYIDQPGKVKMKAVRRAGLKLSDLIFHFIYSSEALWSMIEPSEDGRTISILDLNGVSMFDFAGEVVDFVKRTIALSGEHYPERAYRIYVINAPRFFAGVWSVVKPWVDEETRKKIGIFRSISTFKPVLLEEIDEDVLPEMYGGTNTKPLDQSYEERLLNSHVCRVLIEQGVPMLDDDGEPIPGSPANLRDQVDDSLESGVSKLNLEYIAKQNAAKK
ncbi:Phosphatidylinositol/phosphatidylcholine transfer protein SFH9 [Hondaea fermentalgiana]|uniref:Phosphatidylinositol/phosphatidylcholine transfer protein SFH9 n=1 Tax=Hondaea fermentalgiana TaxID=2315210 RepID=A0A2R5GNR6_9STRA|nr:Phosphatidylinositol/phosphatidylcholine transfer protein SFH9 [Hondaea fermentalgiana]|eukprot:GBG29514.1 Phosphatidylinositol/phosphatidylcholine transfer protein SFH9 [Hondaea fermentalgiana]